MTPAHERIRTADGPPQDGEGSCSSRAPSRTGRPLLVGVLSCVMLASAALYTVHSNFSIYFHVDEISKANQVISGSRNFNHPLLFIEAHTLAARLAGVVDQMDKNLADVVRAGRTVSALFAAVCAGAMGLWAARTRGRAAGILAASGVGLCPMLLVNAHYAKEETALAMGLCLTVAAFGPAWGAPAGAKRAWALVVLGICVGLAVSSKYVGMAALPVALAAIVRTPRAGAWPRLASAASCLVPMLATVALIHARVLGRAEEWGVFAASAAREAEHATSDHYGYRLYMPTRYFMDSVFDHTPVLVLVPFALYAGMIAIDVVRRRARADEVCAVTVALGYLLVISFSVIPSSKYVLGAVVLIHAMAALGAVRAAGLVPRRAAAVVVIALAGCLLVPSALRSASYTRQLGDDSRDRLAAWIDACLPPEAVVLQDQRIMLERWRDGQGQGLSQRLETRLLAPDLGTIEECAAKGITHIAICDIAYARHFDPRIAPTPSGLARFAHSRSFYARLLAGEFELVWASVPEVPTMTFTNPEIRLYRLVPAHAGSTPVVPPGSSGK